jgi:hypothetical protein
MGIMGTESKPLIVRMEECFREIDNLTPPGTLREVGNTVVKHGLGSSGYGHGATSSNEIAWSLLDRIWDPWLQIWPPSHGTRIELSEQARAFLIAMNEQRAVGEI